MQEPRPTDDDHRVREYGGGEPASGQLLVESGELIAGSKTTVAAARHIVPATGLPASMRPRPVVVSSEAVTP